MAKQPQFLGLLLFLSKKYLSLYHFAVKKLIFNCMKKILLIGGGLALVYYFYNAQTFGKYVKARFSGLQFDLNRTKANLFTQIWFNVKLQVLNPSNFGVAIKAVSIDILYNGRKIGTVEKLGETLLKPYSENNFEVPAAIPTFSIFGTVQNAINALTNKTPINLNLQGVIVTNSGTVEVNEHLTL